MDSSISESARRAIDTISNGEEVQTITLSALSNLKRPELSLFMKAFLAQNDEYRIHVINRMIEIAEDIIEYNFDNIFRLCLKDTHEDVRYGAVEGLWENEETSLIDPLIDILENDESAKVQAAAATALGKFAVMAELKQIHPESAEKVIDTLLSAIDNRDNATDVTKRVLESAASISLPDVHDAINNAYYSSNPDLKISALFAMGKSFDSSWLPILIQELENDDAAVRFEAAGACGELESPEAVPALVTLAENDEDIEVRCAAIQALGKIGSPPAQEYIQLCLKSSNDAVREAAEDALGFIHAFDETLFHEWKDE